MPFFVPVFVLCMPALYQCKVMQHDEPMTQLACSEKLSKARDIVRTDPQLWFSGECFSVPTSNYKLSPKDLMDIKKRLSPSAPNAPKA